MGGFVTLHHNKLKDITGALLEEVCHDVAVEPILQPVPDNNLVPSKANSNDGARLDVSAKASGTRPESIFLTSGCLTPTLHDTNPNLLNSSL